MSSQITVKNPGNEENKDKNSDAVKQPEPKSNGDTTNNKLNNKNECCGDSKKQEQPKPLKMNKNNHDDSKFMSPPPTIKDMKIPRSLRLTASPSIDTPKRSLFDEFSALLSPVAPSKRILAVP